LIPEAQERVRLAEAHLRHLHDAEMAKAVIEMLPPLRLHGPRIEAAVGELISAVDAMMAEMRDVRAASGFEHVKPNGETAERSPAPDDAVVLTNLRLALISSFAGSALERAFETSPIRRTFPGVIDAWIDSIGKWCSAAMAPPKPPEADPNTAAMDALYSRISKPYLPPHNEKTVMGGGHTVREVH
jgi:hypothetical protein